MGTRLFPKKDKSLGVSEKHTYDIPLDKGSGRLFLTILTGIMVFLMLLSVSAAHILTDFAREWQTGLEGHWTVELPVIDENGENLSESEIDKKSDELIASLSQFHAIETVTLMKKEDVMQLLSPWFETSAAEGTSEENPLLPIPILISLKMQETGSRAAHDIKMEIEKISPLARLDQHESWLNELLRLTGTLRLISVLITLTISIAGIMAIAGAMQSRMAEHKESVELLHLMGASDGYIIRQFQRHAFIISLQGAFLGLIICALFIYALSWFLSGSDETLLPNFTPTLTFWSLFLLVPFIIVSLCIITTKWAVLHRLQKML